MKRMFTTVSASSMFLVASAVAASAQDRRGWLSNWLGGFLHPTHNSPHHNVPEIDASSGLLAMAAILAALVLAWEIKRRRA